MRGLIPDYFSLTANVGKIPPLDGLRAVAILLVLMRHATYPVTERYNAIASIGSWDLRVPLLNGWMGVDLFFVISGFLITHHLLNRWPGRLSIGFMLRYWSKRILRTFPAYYAAVAIAIVGLVPMFDPRVDDLAYTLRVHLAFLQDYLGSNLVPAFWSLGVEEKFYLLCPLVLWVSRGFALRRKIPFFLVLAVTPAALRWATLADVEAGLENYVAFFWQIRSPFHLAMDGLWVGVMCALIYRERSRITFLDEKFANRLLVASMFVLAVLMWPAAWFDDQLFVPAILVLNIVSFAFGGVLFAVICGRTFLNGLLESAALRAISTLSYSIYLVHMMFVPLSLGIVDALLGNSADVNAVFYLGIFAVVFCTLSFAAGAVLHFTVEKPFLLLKDRIKI